MDACPDEALLHELADQTLRPDEAVTIRAHLEGCEVCRKTVALLIREHRASPAFARTLPGTKPAPRPVQVGRFTILDLIGRGGMGEIYRARDSQLGREVAIKLLTPALRSDPAWASRFEREARTIGQLNHPNLLALYDIGVHDGASYVVTELLEGTTLRARLGAPLPVARALEIGAEIAAGLAAAHETGIVHRDVKPENIFLTRDGRVKILDFGLAKYQPTYGNDAVEAGQLTEPGTILGTVGYMAPEQVRGKPVDGRSDIFSLGVVLYEMLAGRTPFADGNDAEVMTAVLRDAPRPLPATVPWVAARLVLRCLEKEPLERFQSARDLAADLREALSVRDLALPRRRPSWPLAVAGTGAAALVAAALVVQRGLTKTPPEARIDYTRLTFHGGVVDNARFAPDGRTVIYSASLGGEGPRVYATVPGGRESRALTEPGYSLAAVGRDGELAVLRGHTLARMSMSGATPRDVADDVTEADFTPAGELVVLHADAIELPPGHPLYRAPGKIQSLRVAPDGDRIAFVEHPIAGDDAGRVCTVTRAGVYGCSTDAHWYIMNRVAWAPGGGEPWFSAIDEGSRGGIYAVAPSGPPRRLVAQLLSASIFDVGPSGALVRFADLGMSAHYRDPDGMEHDMSWLDVSIVAGLAPDGSAILLAEGGMGGTSDYEAYLRPTDGGPAVDIGAGFPGALSDDKQWAVLFQRRGDRHQLVVMPTGAGAARELPPGPIEHYAQGYAAFFPGATRIVYNARAAGDWQVFAQDVAGGAPVPLTEAGWHVVRPALTPDGRTLLCVDAEGRYVLRPLDGSQPRPLPQLGAAVRPLRFSPDGRALFVQVIEGPRHSRVTRLDLETGVQTQVSDLRTARDMPSSIGPFATADGRGLAYSELQEHQSLYVVTGLGL